MSASLTNDGRHRLHIQRECCRACLDEEMILQQKRREMHKSRPFRVWSSGKWCWFWRSRAHLHRRTKASRQFKEGAFLGPARVLLQERERKGDDLKYKAVVWVVDGDQLVRCSSTHLRPVSTAEQTLCSLRDGEARTFQQVVQELPKRNFVDLVGQPFEEPMNVASSDDELHEDFLSGEEFASAPDDSEVPKDPQIDISNTVRFITCRDTSSYVTRTYRSTIYSKSRTEFFHSTSFGHTTTHCSTVIDVATINDTTDSLTITYGIITRSNVSVSSNEASFGTNSSAGVETNESW